MSVAPLALPWATASLAESTSRHVGEPDWMLADRLDALGRATTLPAEPNQLFTGYLDLRSVDFKAVEPHAPTSAGSAADAGQLPEGAAAFIHVREDGPMEWTLGPQARESGVIVETFAEAIRAHPDLLRSAIAEGRSLPADDAFGQVARALSTLGVFVHVPPGVVLGEPIVLRWTAGSPARAMISRTVVTLGAGAHARFFEEQMGIGDAPVEAVGDASADGSDTAASQWWGTTEIDLGAGATLEFAGEQDFGTGTAAFVTRHARLADDASLSWAIASVGGRLFRSRIDNELVGRGATVRQVEIGFGDGRQLFDLTSYTRHRGQDGTSDLLSKGVFTGRSRGYIKGLIEIAHSARGTDTFLGEHSMLLERSARSVTIPSLEIDQPDVRRAMHSSSVGPIDEMQVFYLMSRGLSRDAARKAIVLGFLEPVVARIPLPEAQDRLRTLLEKKWPALALSRAAA